MLSKTKHPVHLFQNKSTFFIIQENDDIWCFCFLRKAFPPVLRLHPKVFFLPWIAVIFMTAQYIHNMEFCYLNSSSLNPAVCCIVEFGVCWHLNQMKTEHISMWEVFSKFWHLDITNLDPVFSVSMRNPKWTEHNIKYRIFKLLYNLKDKQAWLKKKPHTPEISYP